MSPEIRIFLLILAILLFLTKKIFNHRPWFRKYGHFITLTVVLILAVMLSIDFWKSEIYVGIFAIGLALLAVIKVIRDTTKS